MGRIVAAIAAVIVLAGCGSPSRPTPTTERSSAAAAATSTTRPPLADVDFSDEADTRYLAALAAKGIALDETDAISAGYGVCTMMLNEGATLIDSSAWVMDTFATTGPQAGQIAGSAIDVYCPTARP